MSILTFCLLLFFQTTQFNPEFYSEKGVCPFEGCLYGEWSSIDSITVYEKPEKQKKVGSIPNDKKFEAVDGLIHIVPGIVYKIKDVPTIGYSETDISKFAYEEPIYILHYVGEGFHKAYHQGEFTYIQFANDKEALEKYSTDFDWLRVERLATNFEWWVQVKYKDVVGWIEINKNVEAIDQFE